MRWTFEYIAKNLLLAALALLVFRNTSFVVTGIPKPFEALFILVVLLTLVDLCWNRKWAVFFAAIPKRILIAALVMVGSIGIGWLAAVFLRDMPSTLNMFHEFSAFMVAAVTGVLVLYYSHGDEAYIRRVLYALCIPALYTFAVFVPDIALKIGIADGGTFRGFTDNVNIVSKALLIPLMTASAYALVSNLRLWQRALAIILAASLFALVLWTSQRAAILAFIASAGSVWVVLAYIQRDWKKMIRNGVMLVVIIAFGFGFVPHEGKKAALDRILNLDGNQSGYEKIKDKTIAEIVETSIQKDQGISTATIAGEKTPEPRFLMWKEYGRIVLANPLGLGPNTHMPVTIHSTRVTFQNPGPHNTYLTTWLWGGVAGIAAFLYILFVAFRSSIKAIKADLTPVRLAIFGSFAALAIALFFNDSLPYIWFWVLLAGALHTWDRQS